MKLLPLPPTSQMPTTRGRLVPSPLVADQAAELPAPPRDSADADWHTAYLRRRATDDDDDDAPRDEPQAGTPCQTPWTPREPALDRAEVRAAQPSTTPKPSTPATERVDTLRRLAEAPPAVAPTARTWQVDLPAAQAGAAWQLRVEQAQPLAPLNVELRVPPVAQAQARQQLGELDKRLREAGHDVLRTRLRDHTRASRRSTPVEGVEP